MITNPILVWIICIYLIVLQFIMVVQYFIDNGGIFHNKEKCVTCQLSFPQLFKHQFKRIWQAVTWPKWVFAFIAAIGFTLYSLIKYDHRS